ncbi:MAG: DUF3786 domain-containing protein [Oscillibacter sp.]|nr:DUF3786 domain-containing protein [Oscillibacter sp.]
MKKSEFLARLQQAVTPAEWEALEQGSGEPVSAFNREVLLELRDASAPAGEVDPERAEGMYEALRAYLTEYMAEQPSGWKYVFLASLYLVFLAGRPMHPVDRMEIKVAESENGTVYTCPQKSALPGTVCDWCVCKRMSNYEITQRKMARAFAEYDQEAMIRKFHLSADGSYLYINFLNRPYRIHRRSGDVTWMDGGSLREAGFEDAMTIYDVLCNAREGCAAAGEFASINHLMKAAGKPEQNGVLDARQIRLFDHREQALSQACRALGGTEYGKGDVAYRLPLFDFLPAAVQFWSSDDEFPASLQLLWDKNILDFMHFETVWYAAGYLLDRLQELVEDMEFSG